MVAIPETKLLATKKIFLFADWIVDRLAISLPSSPSKSAPRSPSGSCPPLVRLRSKHATKKVGIPNLPFSWGRPMDLRIEGNEDFPSSAAARKEIPYHTKVTGSLLGGINREGLVISFAFPAPFPLRFIYSSLNRRSLASYCSDIGG